MCRRCALQHEAGDLLIVRKCMAFCKATARRSDGGGICRQLSGDDLERREQPPAQAHFHPAGGLPTANAANAAPPIAGAEQVGGYCVSPVSCVTAKTGGSCVVLALGMARRRADHLPFCVQIQ
jgi:hypothetical protein